MEIIEIKEIIEISSKKDTKPFYSKKSKGENNQGYIFVPYIFESSTTIINLGKFEPKPTTGRYYSHIYDWEPKYYTTNNISNNEILASYR